MSFKVLINVPDLTIIGGVPNYYAALKGRFQGQVDYITYGSRGRPGQEGIVGFALRLLKDNLNLAITLLKGKHQLVHLNPSLETKGFFRDAISFFIAHWILRRKVLVFWRGWDSDFQQVISSKYMWVMRLTYLRASGMIVLAEEFKSQLRNWGYDGAVFLETTVLDEALIEGLDTEKIQDKFREQKTNLLFLGRLEENKGIFEILDVYSKLKREYPELNLWVLGDGSAMHNVRQFIEKIKLSDVNLLGFVRGEVKKDILQTAHVYLFPSRHAEGLPNSVLEAMGCGMPVLTTANAGIKDFFNDPEMGYILKDGSADTLEKVLRQLLKHREIQEKMAIFNHEYAKQRFAASMVVKRLEAIYHQVVFANFTQENLPR